MKIQSGGFPLLKLTIAENEYLPAYVLNQILYGTRGKAQHSFNDHTPDIRNFSWTKIVDVKGLSERPDMSLPSMDECIMGHTLFPYLAWSLSKKDAEKLYAQYAYPPTNKCAIGEDFPKEIGGFIKSSKGLGWCNECAKFQTTGVDSRPFPIRHRLHFAPNILICHIHHTPLSIFCDVCHDESNWIPTIECLCQDGPKSRAHMGAKMQAAMSAITSKANEILEQCAPSELTPLAIKQAIKKRFPRGIKGDGSRVARVFDAIVENIGEEAPALLELTEISIHKFIANNGPPSVRNPIRILAFGFASFNGFEGLMETINGSTKWIPNINSTSMLRKRSPYDLNRKRMSRSEFGKIVAKMSLTERNELEHQGRTWLLDKLKKHPNLTRNAFWWSHTLVTYKFYYLVWIDTAWFKEQLPAKHEIRAKEKNSTISEITSAMIYERRASSLNKNPSQKITKTLLMHPLNEWDMRSLELRSPEIREALKECCDTAESRRARAVHAICELISKHFPKHRYADAKWYNSGDAGICAARLIYSRKWLISRTSRP